MIKFADTLHSFVTWTQWDVLQAPRGSAKLCGYSDVCGYDERSYLGFCTAPATTSMYRVDYGHGEPLIADAQIPMLCHFHAIANGSLELRTNEIPADLIEPETDYDEPIDEPYEDPYGYDNLEAYYHDGF